MNVNAAGLAWLTGTNTNSNFPLLHQLSAKEDLQIKAMGVFCRYTGTVREKNGPPIPRWKSCEQNTLLFALWVVIQKLAQLSQVWMIGWNRFCVLLKMKNTGGSNLKVPFLRSKTHIALTYIISYKHTSLPPINSTFITSLPSCIQQISIEKTKGYFCTKWHKLRRATKQLWNTVKRYSNLKIKEEKIMFLHKKILILRTLITQA